MRKIYLPLTAVFMVVSGLFPANAQDTAKISFSGMNPHVGQNLYFRVVDQSNDMEVGRTSLFLTVPDFTLGVGGIQAGSSYNLDFYADMNKNGRYDFPGDHTWRISLDSVEGDTTVAFAHNTNFTDIAWVYQLTVALTNMNPHLGQNLYFALKNKAGIEMERKKLIAFTASFNVGFNGIMPDSSYMIDFFADHNKNGRYDPPGADHAWRIAVDDVVGDTIVPFVHNTSFTDIKWNQMLTIALTNMNPHMGQHLYFRLVNTTTGMEIERKKLLEVSPDFNVGFDSILTGSSYTVDFFADHNKNGRYDPPGADHAWRITVESVNGDTVIPFVHNTSFTDISWPYKLTVNFTDMNPHINQLLNLYLRNNITGAFIDTATLDPVTEVTFRINLYTILPDSSYNIDFYTDGNGNRTYDVPPTDHAWRIELLDVRGDTMVDFHHNTEFTDIGIGVVTGIGDDLRSSGFSTYPNPASDVLVIKSKQDDRNLTHVKVYNSSGKLVIDHSVIPQGSEARINISALKPGLYILSVSDGVNSGRIKFVKQ